ncbi:FG-GAP-like repeat-containing protein [Nocardioides coralli]|uniref:FG-GAP-like repeat-containing protein n=1 Tax=Nocardioides coralli TaxID=2872154 RepID=UPI001CA45D31|nr:FG-GAP-like repeat-containing protein [Nocardioides coralli]QZY30011.1 FG-GAP-like repeat-containing protein [Nocardioides coralli]
MRRSQSQFVTSCQQLLALGAVLAVLTPAASVVSLDVVRQAPQPVPGAAGGGRPAEFSAYTRAAQTPSRVSTAPVDAEVTDHQLTPDPGVRGRVTTRARTTLGGRVVTSEAEPVDGFGGVGVTWDPTAEVDEDLIAVSVRTRTGDTWSEWTGLEYHAEHGPDPDSPEGLGVRPGTDVTFVGEVDEVQVRATAPEGAPAGLRLSVVTPGEEVGTAQELPELGPGADAAATTQAEGTEDGEVALELAARSTSAPRPTIFSRKQWGADERLRDGRPSYGTVKAGFVHHTVNANDYSRSDVPGMLRSIYAYHTQSRGWSDIGYNFLVDKFGRIWEGRAGGVKRPVIGAHTLGYNHESFAMSAIGNFDTAEPTAAMLQAYGALFAWKLGLHGVDPRDSNQVVAGDRFRAINGHRDAGSTACPGRYLYAELPTIRRHAANAGEVPTEPEPPQEPETPEIQLDQVDSDLVGTRYPDLVVRRASDGRGLIVPTGGLTWFTKPRVLAEGWGTRTTLAVPDMTGDGRPDLVTRDAAGAVEVRALKPSGPAAGVHRRMRRFEGAQLLALAGRVNGDRRPDFVARHRGRLVSFLSNRKGGYRRVTTTTGLRGATQVVGAGDVTGDGRPDLWMTDRKGRLHLHRNTGDGRFRARERVAGSWGDYDWYAGGVDYTADGVPDLVARGSDGLFLLPGRGDGTLGRATGPVRGGVLSMVSGAGQLVGDEAPDLVAVTGNGALVVLPNRGTFDLGKPVDTGRSFSRGELLLNAGDFTGDGHGDVILRRGNGSLWLYTGNGTGRLGKPVRIGGKYFGRLVELRVTADVTGDGEHDLVGLERDGSWTLWQGRGAELVTAGTTVRATERHPLEKSATYDWMLPISDLAGRGVADVVARDRDGLLYRLDGRRRSFGTPRYLGEGAAYDLGG